MDQSSSSEYSVVKINKDRRKTLVHTDSYQFNYQQTTDRQKTTQNLQKFIQLSEKDENQLKLLNKKVKELELQQQQQNDCQNDILSDCGDYFEQEEIDNQKFCKQRLQNLDKVGYNGIKSIKEEINKDENQYQQDSSQFWTYLKQKINKKLIQYGSISELGIKKKTKLDFKLTNNAYFTSQNQLIKFCEHDKNQEHKKTFSCTIFEQNYNNGDCYLTHYQIQQRTQCDDNYLNCFNVIQAFFLQYNPAVMQFERRGEIVLDIINCQTSPKTFLLQTVQRHNEKAYFYRKNYVNGDQVLQLYKHKMEVESDYSFLSSQKDNDEDDYSSSFTILSDRFSLIIPKQYDITKMDYCFITDATYIKKNEKKSFQEDKFLENQYILIKSICDDPEMHDEQKIEDDEIDRNSSSSLLSL